MSQMRLEPLPVPDLREFDIVLVNSSAGKDSQAMLDVLVEAADAAGVRDRLVVAHCDLGRVEWPKTADLAAEHAAYYGLRFEKVGRDRDLLHQVEFERKKWPSAAARYCTSDQKTSQVAKLMTRLVAEAALPRPVRILNCLGIRAQESPARAKKIPLGRDSASNGKRDVVRWLPIFDWTVDEVWERIAKAGTRHHSAYDLGMPRLSCVFCVLASDSALMIAARHAPALADEYVRVEAAIGHTFKHGTSIASIVERARTEAPAAAEDWSA